MKDINIKFFRRRFLLTIILLILIFNIYSVLACKIDVQAKSEESPNLSSNVLYNRQAAYNYAQIYWDEVCSDGYFWDNPSPPATSLEAGTCVIGRNGYDCAHFVSCCIGSEPNQIGGGLNVPSRVPPSYGEPGAAYLGDWLINENIAIERNSIDDLELGDIINYDWNDDGHWDHIALYLDNNEVAAHTESVWKEEWQLGGAYRYRFIHLLPETSLKTVQTTAYYCIYETEALGTESISIIISGISFNLKASFLYGGYGVAMQGTGRTGPNGGYIHIDNPQELSWVHINDPSEFTQEVEMRYNNLGINDFTGLGNLALTHPENAIFSVVSGMIGSSGNILIEWYSIAVDPEIIPLNTVGTLLFESGKTTPEGFKNMIFRADDTGGGIQEDHIDIYVGEGQAAIDEWYNTGGNRKATISIGNNNIDLVFVIDTTGSMWDDIDSVKESASTIISDIFNNMPSARIALVDYKDFPIYPYGGSSDYPYRKVLGFSEEEQEIISAIQSLTASGGADWEESVYSALMYAIDASDLGGWRGEEYALKIIIQMGDAPPHDPEPITGYISSDVISAAINADPVHIYSIQIGTEIEELIEISEETDGNVYPAEDANEVVESILEIIEEIIDINPPIIEPIVPIEEQVLQDGVTLQALVSDISGVNWVTFSIRESDGSQGIVISPEFEGMTATYIGDDLWRLPFETKELPDGYYVMVITATDIFGNQNQLFIEFSIRNWACVELLPSTERNKAGRTMPIKFSIRIDATVDNEQPFVYNEELIIKIYDIDDLINPKQVSLYGLGSKDYRIDSIGEKYITNFKTSKQPSKYLVMILRAELLIDSFEFETVK